MKGHNSLNNLLINFESEVFLHFTICANLLDISLSLFSMLRVSILSSGIRLISLSSPFRFLWLLRKSISISLNSFFSFLFSKLQPAKVCLQAIRKFIGEKSSITISAVEIRKVPIPVFDNGIPPESSATMSQRSSFDITRLASCRLGVMNAVLLSRISRDSLIIRAIIPASSSMLLHSTYSRS